MLTLGAMFQASAETSWVGIYLQGNKVGYASTTATETQFEGKKASRSEMRMVVQTQMLSQQMKITVRSVTIATPEGSPIYTEYFTESSGRSLGVNARFYADRIEAVLITAAGEQPQVIKIPEGVRLAVDPSQQVMDGSFPLTNGEAKAYVFNPEGMNLVEVTVRPGGKQKVEIDGKTTEAQTLRIQDPRAPSTMYVGDKGEFLLMTGPMGMEFRPESESAAKQLPGVFTGDLAVASMIVPTGKLDPLAKKLILRVEGVDLSKSPSDAGQSIKPEADAWIVTVEPNTSADKNATIAQAQHGMERWLKPDIRVPSDSKEFKDLAQKIVGDEKRVTAAAEKIHREVYGFMGVNAGIGVMRDAREILETKEGVCRDHAILAGTILRAAGIPARFVNGLVYQDGAYYYHAWVEFWDGKAWIGLDTTRMPFQMTAKYIKTAQGTVGEALQGFLLDGAKITVIANN